MLVADSLPTPPGSGDHAQLVQLTVHVDHQESVERSLGRDASGESRANCSTLAKQDSNHYHYFKVPECSYSRDHAIPFLSCPCRPVFEARPARISTNKDPDLGYYIGAGPSRVCRSNHRDGLG